MVLVSKFGGSSLADAIQMQKVIDIILANSERKVIVPSAPGKIPKNNPQPHAYNERITDELRKVSQGNAESASYIIDRFKQIESDL